MVEIDDKVARALQKLQAQAAFRQLPFDQYLELIATAWEVPTGVAEHSSVDEIEVMLDEFADSLPAIPPLPADFSRRDIYADHD